MKPNIFEIGTKELNQDVFITWLLQYADETDIQKYNDDDRLISKCGKDFIKRLIERFYTDYDGLITKIEAGRQWEKIDVWATVNDKYLIIIEDKTFTSHHSDQLTRYRKTAEKWCEEQKTKYEKPICIYLKTGNESLTGLNFAQSQGFKIFNRQHFLQLLQNHSNVKNQIFIDFTERLQKLEHAVKQFEIKRFETWEDYDWEGFYQYLESSIGLVNWNKLNNPNGGFINAIVDWPYWNEFPVHWQIEQGRIAFKFCTEASERGETDNSAHDINSLQDRWQSILLSNASNRVPELKRPSPYMHKGDWRTVAYIDRNDWLGQPNAILDKSTVLLNLNRYKEFVLFCTQQS
jgi:hypothetical protein